MSAEFEFSYIKFSTNSLTGGKSAERKTEIFIAHNEDEAGKYLVAFCRRGYSYAEGTFYRRDGANKEKLRDPVFPGRAREAA